MNQPLTVLLQTWFFTDKDNVTLGELTGKSHRILTILTFKHFSSIQYTETAADYALCERHWQQRKNSISMLFFILQAITSWTPTAQVPMNGPVSAAKHLWNTTSSFSAVKSKSHLKTLSRTVIDTSRMTRFLWHFAAYLLVAFISTLPSSSGRFKVKTFNEWHWTLVEMFAILRYSYLCGTAKN